VFKQEKSELYTVRNDNEGWYNNHMPEEMSYASVEGASLQRKDNANLMEDPAERNICDSCQ